MWLSGLRIQIFQSPREHSEKKRVSIGKFTFPTGSTFGISRLVESAKSNRDNAMFTWNAGRNRLDALVMFLQFLIQI